MAAKWLIHSKHSIHYGEKTMTTQSYCPTLMLYVNSGFRSTQERMRGMTAENLKLVDDIYRWAEEHYGAGGHWIVEAMTPWEVLREFPTVADAKAGCELREDVYGDVRAEAYS